MSRDSDILATFIFLAAGSILLTPIVLLIAISMMLAWIHRQDQSATVAISIVLAVHAVALYACWMLVMLKMRSISRMLSPIARQRRDKELATIEARLT